ncbi:6-hydroxymethylpterin diphosphokinase MptE-like protein [Chloroflexota bacterium]
MQYIKTSWENKKKTDVPVEILEHIAARGSFVVIRSKMLYRDFSDRPKEKRGKESQDLSLAEQINQKVRDVNLKMWMENLASNIQTINKHKDISQIPKMTGRTAIIVGAGPSFNQKGHMEVLRQAKNHTIMSTDRMLVPLLESNITPDFTVSVDGHREAIVQFYDSELVNGNTPTVAVMAVTVAPNVVQRFSGKKFFFTPMIDDIDQPVSLTSAISLMTGTSILSTGGNVGINCVYLAFYLGYKNIILTGLDLGYTRDTPIENSAYYRIVKEADPTLTPEIYKELYVIEGYNPDFKVDYYTDVAWKSHIDAFVKQSKFMSERGANLINATEGGSLHGGAIQCLPLKEAISRYA